MNIITLDGPSAAGKGTIGKLLAQRLGCLYLDSGLIYRQFAKWALAAGVDLSDESAVYTVLLVQLPTLDLVQADSHTLRTANLSDAASKIGVLPSVRRLANEFQRKAAASYSGWVVVDGRDAGTVVFPDAEVKLFVTATPDVRARRRYHQLAAEGGTPSLEELETEIIQRDLRDQNREIAPLRPAPDAYIIDTSNEIPQESIHRILKYVEKYVTVC